MVRPTHFVSKIVPLRGAFGQSPYPLNSDLSPAPRGVDIIDDAPEDSYTYGRRNGEWVRIVPLAGATMEGPLYLYDDPTAPLEAATKRYLDQLMGNIDSGTF